MMPAHLRHGVLLSALLLCGACATPIPRPAAPEPPPPAARLQPAQPPPTAALTVLAEEPAPDLWQRFAEARHWQPCVPDAAIERWIALYAGKRERFANSLTPMLPMMDYVLDEALALGLPAETMLLPLVESHYRVDARGPGGAQGMWQLMPATATHLKLRRGAGIDERNDLRLATLAALELLQTSHESFDGNAKLTFAAYNAGAWRLRKATSGRNHRELRSLDGLGLNGITRSYIEKIKALSCLLGEPQRFDLVLPPYSGGATRLKRFEPPHPIDPKLLPALLGIEQEQLRAWNRLAFARGAADAAHPLLLPADQHARLGDLIADGRLPPATPRAHPADPVVSGSATHRVAKGDSLWTIAKRYRVRLADLMDWNGLHARSVLRIGQPIRLRPP